MCDAKTFFGVINAFRSLNLFSLLPLSRQEYMVMFVIAGQRKTNPEGSTVSMVTQKMHVPQPAVSRTLRGLENDGYICREVCRTDRRNTYVTLTAAGEERCSGRISCWRIFTGGFRNALHRKKPTN